MDTENCNRGSIRFAILMSAAPRYEKNKSLKSLHQRLLVSFSRHPIPIRQLPLSSEKFNPSESLNFPNRMADRYPEM
jgi:hypothetical protein